MLMSRHPDFLGFREKADGKERYRDTHTNRERERTTQRVSERQGIGVGRMKDIL